MVDDTEKGAGSAMLGAGPIALVTAAFLVVMMFVVGSQADAACNPAAAGTIDLEELPEGPIAGFDGEQLANAATIANAASAMGLPGRAQLVGIMTAIGESSLNNIAYGDDINGVTNPDGSPTCSLGLFQQQWCLGWGTREQVLDPTYAATAFFERLQQVDGWEELEPTLAINRVQGNADPYHYERFEAAATQILDALAPGATGETGCSTTGWVSPVDLDDPNMMLTSWFGMRSADLFGYAYFHSGVDFSAPEGTPIYAAAAGTVSEAVKDQGTANSGLGNVIIIDHGEGLQTRYQHMPPGGVHVDEGQRVEAGQQIGVIGTSGSSSGDHLHYSVLTNGKTTTDFAVDPIPFMLQRGIDFCSLPQATVSSTVNTCR